MLCAGDMISILFIPDYFLVMSSVYSIQVDLCLFEIKPSVSLIISLDLYYCDNS